MVMTDPIADLLTRIRNANMVRHEKLEVPASKIKREIAEILKREGFIRDVEYVEDSKQGIIICSLNTAKTTNVLSLVLKESVNLVYAYMRNQMKYHVYLTDLESQLFLHHKVFYRTKKPVLNKLVEKYLLTYGKKSLR